MTNIDQYKADHLFLLVGTNPLPDWVAARLLLRSDGVVYLVYSSEPGKTIGDVQSVAYTASTAKKLADYLSATTLRTQPVYVPVAHESDSAVIYAAVYNAIRKLKETGKIDYDHIVGLNYTGGTKVMAVHAYRAITDCHHEGHFVQPILSYLDARRLELAIDPTSSAPNREVFDVALSEEARIDLSGLFELHQSRVPSLKRDVKARPIIDALVALAASPSDWQAFKQWASRELNEALLQKLKRNMPRSQLENLRRTASATQLPDANVNPRLMRLVRAVTSVQPAQQTGVATLGSTCGAWGFTGFDGALDFAKFLDGAWLEHYVLACVQQHIHALAPARQGLYECARSVEFTASDRTEFEIDAAVMRGYQLYFVTCYSGRFGDTIKNKFFEACIRARQLGGDEAKVALVCCDDSPRLTQNQLAERWGMGDRVRIFGRADLTDLSAGLSEWID